MNEFNVFQSMKWKRWRRNEHQSTNFHFCCPFRTPSLKQMIKARPNPSWSLRRLFHSSVASALQKQLKEFSLGKFHFNTLDLSILMGFHIHYFSTSTFHYFYSSYIEIKFLLSWKAFFSKAIPTQPSWFFIQRLFVVFLFVFILDLKYY